MDVVHCGSASLLHAYVVRLVHLAICLPALAGSRCSGLGGAPRKLCFRPLCRVQKKCYQSALKATVAPCCGDALAESKGAASEGAAKLGAWAGAMFLELFLNFFSVSYVRMPRCS
jgi:hypothetical protein